MKANEPSIVLPGMQSVLTGFGLLATACSASVFGVGVVAALQTFRGAMPLAVGLVMAPIGLGFGAAGLFVMLGRWSNRLSAPHLLVHLQNERPLLLYRVFFVASLAMLVAGFVLSAWSNYGMGLVQTGAMFAGVLGGLEWFRRRVRMRARILFTLYADGMLDPEATAAIDAARSQDERFDAAVRSFQQWNAAVTELSRATTDG